jgi:aerobic carbon-monoxide dehydrogenase large subunit
MTTPIPFVGTLTRRLEDAELVRGAARYVADLQLPGMLRVAFVRCPLGHARVRTLSLDHARNMPGVVAAFGPRDLAVLAKPMQPMNRDPGIKERTPRPLTDEVRYAGDAVAVVVADDPYRVADAADAVDIVYDELPAVVDPAEALRAGAPLIHPDVPGNAAGRLSFVMGDIQAAFAQADVTIHEHFDSPQIAGASIEPRGVVAQPGGDNGVAVTLWVSTQAPHVVRRSVAGALGLRTNQVRVITPYVGGGFGPKGRPYPEEIAVAALALQLGRPCCWEATRQEDFQSTYHGHGLSIDAELAARSDGSILGLRARIVQDVGSYLLAVLIVPQYAAEHLIGPYHVPAADVQAVGVYTNKASLTPVRGGGREQGVFVIERLLDHLARKIGIDPLDVRRRNTLRCEEFPYDTRYPKRYGGTIVYDSGDFPSYLEEARELIGYDEVRRAQASERKAGKYRGVAITLFAESTAMGKEGARVEIADDGSVSLAVGSADTGQGHRTTMTQICASELGVAADRICFVSGDTQAMGVGTGTFASRFAVMAGNATALAARQVHQRAVALASELLGVLPQALEICDGVFRVKTQSNRTVTLGEVARQARLAGIPLSHTHIFAPETATTYAGAAHAAVVEVDVETGVATVQRYAVVHDSGQIINLEVVHGQLHGGVVLGLGEALGEKIVYDRTGRLLTDSFQSYVVPRADQAPRIVVKEHSCLSRNNPVGIKGVGENGTMGALPTLIGAVEDALAPLALTLNDMPVGCENLARICAPLRSVVPAGGES